MATPETVQPMADAIKNLASALAIGLSGIGTAYAQSKIGAAAVGGIVEKPEMFGLIVVIMALPELIVILGFAVAFLLKA
jgi:V/A-type H+-transporting ATPase subunit K